MTSERSERVEDESMNRQAGRWRERPSEQARGRGRCPCKVKEGSRQRVVELLRETEGRSHGNPNEAQLPPLRSSQPLKPTASRKGRNALFRWESKLPAEFEELVLRTCSGHDYRRPSHRQHKIAMLKVGWLLNLYLLNLACHGRRAATTIFYWAQKP